MQDQERFRRGERGEIRRASSDEREGEEVCRDDEERVRIVREKEKKVLKS